MAQASFTVSSVAGAGSKTQDVALSGLPDTIYITRVNVVPSASGDSYQVQFFRDDGFTASNLSYDSGAISGTHEDPIERASGVETQHGQDAGIVSVHRDDDSTGELHVKVTNNDASARNFVFLVDYDVPLASEGVSFTASSIVFEGATENAFETTLSITDPTADRTITLPDGGGTVALLGLATQAGTLDVGTLDAATAIQLAGVSIFATANAWSAEQTLNDNIDLTLGTGGDAKIWYDVTNLNIDPQAVGSGNILLAPNGGKVGVGVAPTAQAEVLAGATNRIGLIVDTPASVTASVQEWHYNGAVSATMEAEAAVSRFFMSARDLGNDVAGPTVAVGRNTNAGAEGPVPGTLRLFRSNGADYFVWVDSTVDLRIHSTPPTGSSGSPSVDQLAGTVIGTQTSPKAIKNIIRRWSDEDAKDALDQVLRTPVYDFTFRNGYQNSHMFTGIAIEDGQVPWYGYDPAVKNDSVKDFPVPEGTAKALNEINIAGYMILSARALNLKLETENAELKSQINTNARRIKALNEEVEKLT